MIELLPEIKDDIKVALQKMQAKIDGDTRHILSQLYEDNEDVMDALKKVNVIVCLYDLESRVFCWEDKNKHIDRILETKVTEETIRDNHAFFLMEELLKDLYNYEKGTYSYIEKLEPVVTDKYYVSILGFFLIDNVFIYNIFSRYIASIKQYVVSFMKKYLSYGNLASIDKSLSVLIPPLREVIYRGIHEDRLINFSLLEAISKEKYETTDNFGSLTFMDDKNTFPCFIKFDQAIPFALSNIKYIRKMMELSNNKYSLVITSYVKSQDMEVYSPFISGLLNYTPCSGNTVIFHGYLYFSLMRDGKKQLVYRHGRYFIPKKDASLSLNHQNILKMMFPQYLDNLQEIVSKTIKCNKHGTLLVISDEAESEADRLCKRNRGIRIRDGINNDCGYIALGEHIDEEDDLITNITSIDGALILDERGRCYAIGVILDGNAIADGNPARGARFNSANNYIYVKQIYSPDKKYAVVVISEDGMIDVLVPPKRKMRLKRILSKIYRWMDRLS